MNMEKIGSFLRELRKEKGLTQEQLAQQMLVSNRTVSRWETGANLPELGLLVELAELYQVDLKELLHGERGQRKMEQELKETVYQTAEYAVEQEKRMMKRMCFLFCAGIVFLLLSFAMQFVTVTPGTTAESVHGFIVGFGQGVSLGMLLLGVLLTSGWLQKVMKTKRRCLEKAGIQREASKE